MMKWLITIISTLLVSPTAYAVDFRISGKNGFEELGKVMHQILTNPKSVYFLLIVFLFILFYGIYSAILRKVRIFEGEAATGLNVSGKLICVALSAITLISIVAKYKTIDSLSTAVSNLVRGFGFFGSLLFVIGVYLFLRYGYKDQYFAGLSNNTVAWFGAIIAFLIFAGLGSLSFIVIAVIILFLIISLLFVGIKEAHRYLRRGAPSMAALEKERKIEEVERKEAQEEKKEEEEEEKEEKEIELEELKLEGEMGEEDNLLAEEYKYLINLFKGV